jgi:outer membrane biosynthesis protein TonB
MVMMSSRSSSFLCFLLLIVATTVCATAALAQDVPGGEAGATDDGATTGEPEAPAAEPPAADAPEADTPSDAEPPAETTAQTAEPPKSEPEPPTGSAGSPPPAADITPPSALPSPEPAEQPEVEPTPATEPEPEASPVAPAKPKLLVMNLKANGVPAGTVSAINAAVQQQATRSFVGEVVTAEQLRVTLDANSMQQLVGCDSENCMADFGARVDAKVVLGGNVTAVGEDLIITVLALEPATGKSLGSEQRKVPQVDDLVFYAARQLTSLALTGRAVDPTVPVRVTANAPEAVVFIDGRSVGMAPITVPLDPGQHEVKLEAEDYTPWKLSISVEEGAPLSVDAVLEEQGGFPLWPIALERRYGSPMFLGWTQVLFGQGQDSLVTDLPTLVLFDPVSGPYEAPNKNTAQLSADTNLILLLGIVTDVFIFMTVVSILAAGALLTTDVVLWALEE